MFDKLIESDTAGAEFKNRSRYFMVSSVVVGILFLTAVVISIYAADVGLGDGNFEIAELISPVDAVEPAKDEPSRSTESRSQSSDSPVRNSNIARTDEPTIAPTSFSVTPSTQPARDSSRFNQNLPISAGLGPSTGNSVRSQAGTSVAPDAGNDDIIDTRSTPPPPVIADKPKVKPSVSEGVVNGKATHLPVPPYPAPARAAGAAGEVKVQVAIDENGKVVSARAISGHPLLRGTAEKSAWSARFSTTYLSGVPVKVTGVIVYNFKRN